jgi:hypothetical protein
VSEATVRALITALSDAAKQRTARLTQQYLDGDFGLSEWRKEMRSVVKGVHTASAAVARGGWGQMERTDWGWAGGQVKRQYKALDKFKSALSEHKDKMEAEEADGPGNMLVRASMYGESGKVSYHGMIRRVQQAAGAEEAKRVRSGKPDSCDTCTREERRGWVAVKAVVPIGDSECITRCRCYITYRKKP